MMERGMKVVPASDLSCGTCDWTSRHPPSIQNTHTITILSLHTFIFISMCKLTINHSNNYFKNQLQFPGAHKLQFTAHH